ncbi:MAG TPA: DUF4133 domain-containing protein [Puia sp.]|nr:DUF4133 domain-containing protein [Puia sp.]
MRTGVYTINKGVNRPLEFKGLKAQYIWWLGGGIAGVLLLFAILYISRVNPFVCLGIAGITGLGLFRQVYHMSRTYGQYGLMKKRAARLVPRRIILRTRKTFVLWKEN